MMPKAILELEMPESCWQCPCKGTDVWGAVRCRLIHMKSDKYSGMAEGYANKRRADCPLKLVKGKEGCAYCTPDDNGEYLAKAFYCEKENEHITVMFCDKHAYVTIHTKDDERTASTPIYYCPMCGRRLEVE